MRVLRGRGCLSAPDHVNKSLGPITGRLAPRCDQPAPDWSASPRRGNVTAVVRRGVLGDSANGWRELRNANPGRGGRRGRIAKQQRVQARREGSEPRRGWAPAQWGCREGDAFRVLWPLYAVKLKRGKLWVLPNVYHIRDVYIVNCLVLLLIFSLALA